MGVEVVEKVEALHSILIIDYMLFVKFCVLRNLDGEALIKTRNLVGN